MENCHFADTTVMTHSSRMHILMDSKTIRGKITGEQNIANLKISPHGIFISQKRRVPENEKIPKIPP